MSTTARQVTPEDWFFAYEKAMKLTDYPGFLNEWTLPDLRAKRGLVCYLTPDEKVGLAIYDEGTERWATSLFNVGDIPGAGYALFETMVHDRKITHLDTFAGCLVEMYKTLGFETYEVHEFNPDYAHDWNYERDGRPDVHFMRREVGS